MFMLFTSANKSHIYQAENSGCLMQVKVLFVNPLSEDLVSTWQGQWYLIKLRLLREKYILFRDSSQI